MTKQRLRDIKHAQKESFLLKEIANFFLQISLDEKQLYGLYVNRVKLSSDGGKCFVFFLAHDGKEEFKKKLSTLVLFKPSLRSALAKITQSRYVPQLEFHYDEEFEKQRKVDELIEQLKEEGKL